MQDYKSLCAAITICATVADPKLDFKNYLTHVTLKSQMHLRYKFGDRRSPNCR